MTDKEKESIFYFVVSDEDCGKRLDTFLEKKLTKQKLSRSYIQKNIQKKDTLVNDQTKKKNYKVKKDDIIKLKYSKEIPFSLASLQANLVKNNKGQNQELSPEKEEINKTYTRSIIYEDESIMVVNKEKGLVVHPAQGHYKDTLVARLIDKLTNFNLENNQRPGIVHRLDKDTSGLIIIAKNIHSEEKLKKAFYDRKVKKNYKAIVKGQLLGEGVFQSSIKRHPFKRKTFTTDPNGKEALTLYKTIKIYKHKKNKYYSLLSIKTITGRTHQIRVHLSKAGYPIIGDVLYSRLKEDFEKEGLALIANAISFKHPLSNEEMSFDIDMPEHFNKITSYLAHNSIDV